VTGTTIKKGTEYAVTYAAREAAEAAAGKAATTAAIKVSASKGAAFAASSTAGGVAAMAGEFVGGTVGERAMKHAATKSKYSQAKVDEAAMLGKEFGSLAGATTAGAGAGGLVGGLPGAMAGAGIGAASYGIGKATAFAVDKASEWEGVVLVKPTLSMPNGGDCEKEQAGACIVTEEGIGKCKVYFFRTTEGAQKAFKKKWCSRIMFEMQDGRLAAEVKRGGWPWNQACILDAARRLREPLPPAYPTDVPHRWTEAGVEAMKSSEVWEVLGSPEAGTQLTVSQAELLAGGGTKLDLLVAAGYLQPLDRIFYIWTEAGVQSLGDSAQLPEAFGGLAAGDAVTQAQVAALAEGGRTLEQLVAEGCLTPAEQSLLTVVSGPAAKAPAAGDGV